MATATIEKSAKSAKSSNKNTSKLIRKNNQSKARKAKKTATISMRVEPKLKEEAEEVCARAGLTVSNAIDMFLYQIVRTQGIPVDITDLPPCPDSVNLDKKTKEEFLQELNAGLKDYEEGRVVPFDDVKNRILRSE